MYIYMLRAIGRSDPSTDGSDPSVDPPRVRYLRRWWIWPIGGYCFEKEGKPVMLLKNWMAMIKNVSDKPKMNHNIVWNKA